MGAVILIHTSMYRTDMYRISIQMWVEIQIVCMTVYVAHNLSQTFHVVPRVVKIKCMQVMLADGSHGGRFSYCRWTK